MGKIYFKTTSYHAEKTLERCVDSVLNQTYRSEDIVYYICNNPYTQPDPTEAMVREYAAKEPRIRAFYNKENMVTLPENREFEEFARNLEDDDYLCFLDSDDEYELNFLEALLPFAEENQLDIAACGIDFIDAETNRVIGQRILTQPLVLQAPEDFAYYFPAYHQFMRTIWGKIYSGRVAREMLTRAEILEKYGKILYGSDTLYAFSALRHAKRVGVYPKSLHRYYIHADAGSYQYNLNRPDSDVIRYEDAADYLSKFGPISSHNREFLAQVYANAVLDTVHVLGKQKMPAQEKLHEYRKIAEFPVTQKNYRECAGLGEVIRSRATLLLSAAQCFDPADGAAKEDFAAVVTAAAPVCARAFTPERISLLLSAPELLKTVANDDREGLVAGLLELVRGQRHTKKYDIPAMLKSLSEDKPLLKNADGKLFLRRYGGIYLAVWKGQYDEALDEMTGVLLDGGKADETFLQLYLSLAALQNQATAYVFGKTKLAELRLRQGDGEACRALLDELDEMGASENDMVITLREKLEKSDR